VYWVNGGKPGELMRVIKLNRLKGKKLANSQREWAWDARLGIKHNPTVLTQAELNNAYNIAQFLDDCPVFKEVVTTPHIKPIKTVLPGLHWKVDLEEAVTNVFAPGISLDHMIFNMKQPKQISLLLEMLNTTQAQLAATFDLLIAQGDRHGENVHLREDGSLMLIDNFDKSWHYPNSLFLPQTYIHERLYMGNSNIRNPMTGALAGWSSGKQTKVGIFSEHSVNTQ
jgi:hypothetical protein